MQNQRQLKLLHEKKHREDEIVRRRHERRRAEAVLITYDALQSESAGIKHYRLQLAQAEKMLRLMPVYGYLLIFAILSLLLVFFFMNHNLIYVFFAAVLYFLATHRGAIINTYKTDIAHYKKQIDDKFKTINKLKSQLSKKEYAEFLDAYGQL